MYKYPVFVKVKQPGEKNFLSNTYNLILLLTTIRTQVMGSESMILLFNSVDTLTLYLHCSITSKLQNEFSLKWEVNLEYFIQ